MLRQQPARLTPPRRWHPLTDADLATLAPYFVHRGAGRPMHDIRGRLDAILWVIVHGSYWKDLPPELGPWDTAHRQFRRWVHKGVFTQLLQDVAAPTAPPALRRLEHWICRAFRRGLRLLGVNGIRLARRLGMHSALPGPPWMCPDPDLSDLLWPHIRQAVRDWLARRDWRDRSVLQGAIAYHKGHVRQRGGIIRGV